MDIYAETKEQREERAARRIAEHIDAIRKHMGHIDGLNWLYPDAPVGSSWQALRAVANTINAILNVRDRNAA